MAVAFLAHLMQPISRLLSPLPGDSNSDDLLKLDSQSLTAPQHPALDIGSSNPWLKTSLSIALGLIQRDSAQIASLPVVSQLSESLRGSTQAFGAMCESFTQTAIMLSVPEDLIVDRLKHLAHPSESQRPHSAEYEELQKKMQKLICRYELRVEDEIDHWRAAENRATDLANSARVEITGLRQMLSDERRANSDLLLTFEALRSSGADTSALKTVLAITVPKFQRAAYLEAKGCLLKKIREKYPDADMKYFIDVEEIPEGVDLPPEWLVVPEGQFAYVSSLSVPPLLLNKRRRLR